MRSHLFTLFFFLPMTLMANPKVLIVSAEQKGVVQTGGLADATTGPARALNRLGVHTTIINPGYLKMNGLPAGQVPGQLVNLGRRHTVELDWRDGRPHKRSSLLLFRNDTTGVPTLHLWHSPLPGETNYFDNRLPGNTYGPPERLAEAMGVFDKAVAQHILESDYTHVLFNDWTTGFIPYFLANAKWRGRSVPRSIFTIHNLAFQGNFEPSLIPLLGLDPAFFNIHGYEFHGMVSFLKAGLRFADRRTTVSNKYSIESQTARYGAGFEGLLADLGQRGLYSGYLNGIDVADWTPEIAHPGLLHTFSKNNLSGKALGKALIRRELGFDKVRRKDLPLFVMTSRISEQKGFAYLINAIETMIAEGNSQWVILGDADASALSRTFAARLKALQGRYPDYLHFDSFEGMFEKRLIRYADFFVNGAWFEPSGLNQLYALLNGTLPVVSTVGGLDESVEHLVTGIKFDIVHSMYENYDIHQTTQNAIQALRLTLDTYADKRRLHEMRLAAMSKDNSWDTRVREHLLPLLFEDERPSQKTTQAFKSWMEVSVHRGLACQMVFSGH